MQESPQWQPYEDDPSPECEQCYVHWVWECSDRETDCVESDRDYERYEPECDYRSKGPARCLERTAWVRPVPRVVLNRGGVSRPLFAIVIYSGSTIGTVPGVVAKFATTRRTVSVRHATALGKDTSNFLDGRYYSGTRRIRQIGFSFLLLGRF